MDSILWNRRWMTVSSKVRRYFLNLLMGFNGEVKKGEVCRFIPLQRMWGRRCTEHGEEWKRLGHISGQQTSDWILLKKNVSQREAGQGSKVKRGWDWESLGFFPADNGMPLEAFHARGRHSHSFVQAEHSGGNTEDGLDGGNWKPVWRQLQYSLTLGPVLDLWKWVGKKGTHLRNVWGKVQKSF